MAFDAKSFNREKFAERHQDVPVPALAAYYGEGEAVWTVRCLTGPEMALVKAAPEKHGSLLAMADVLGQSLKEKAEAIKHLFGLDEKLNPEYVMRIEAVTLGSVEPVDRATVVRIGKLFPVVLADLSNAVFALSGLGHEATKKPTGSGENPASETL